MVSTLQSHTIRYLAPARLRLEAVEGPKGCKTFVKNSKRTVKAARNKIPYAMLALIHAQYPQARGAKALAK